MAAKKPAKTETSAAYEVLRNLNHNNRAYIPGEIVELEPEDAAPLLEIDVVKPAT